MKIASKKEWSIEKLGNRRGRYRGRCDGLFKRKIEPSLWFESF